MDLELEDGDGIAGELGQQIVAIFVSAMGMLWQVEWG